MGKQKEKMRLYGSVIPEVEKDYLDKIYPGNEFSQWADGELTRVGFMKDGKCEGPIKIANRFRKGTNVKWYEWLERYWTKPSEQVQNFLQSILVYVGGRKKVSICIREDGAQDQMSWHVVYGMILLATDVDVRIEVVRQDQVMDEATYFYGDRTLKIVWSDKMRSSEYDVFIDCYGKTNMVKVKDIHSYFSEDRGRIWFDRQKRLVVPDFAPLDVLCECSVCKEVAKVCPDYAWYELIRDFVTSLGHVPNCSGHERICHELLVKAETARSILTLPQFRMMKPVQMRAVISLQDEIPLAHPLPKTVSVGTGQEGQAPYTHENGFQVDMAQIEMPQFEWFRSRSVQFVGVSPSLLGQTHIKPVRDDGSSDIAICASMRLLNQVKSKVVYVPELPDIMSKYLNEWKSTGRKIFQYREYEWSAPLHAVEQVQSFYQVYEKKLSRLVFHPYVVDEDPMVGASLSPLERMAEQTSRNEVEWRECVFDKSVCHIRDIPLDITLKDGRNVMWRTFMGEYGFLNEFMWYKFPWERMDPEALQWDTFVPHPKWMKDKSRVEGHLHDISVELRINRVIRLVDVEAAFKAVKRNWNEEYKQKRMKHLEVKGVSVRLRNTPYEYPEKIKMSTTSRRTPKKETQEEKYHRIAGGTAVSSAKHKKKRK